MSFKFHLVDDETFNSLPGKDMRGAVGVSYPEKGEAYIRESGSSILDAFTVAHELEHLKGEDLDEEYDSENRCYYKKASGWNPFGGDFLNFGESFNLHPYILPALEIAASFINPLASAGIGAVEGATAKGPTNYETGEKGQRGSISGALQGGLQGYGVGSLTQAGVGGINSLFGGADAAQNAGYAANAGKVGAEVGGSGIGTGTGIGSAAASNAAGFGGSGLSWLGDTGKNVAQNLGQNSLTSLFGQQGSPYEMPSMGSYMPNISSSSLGGGPNMIAGASGSGSGGGPGGSPGSVGGGQVSKIKQQLESQNMTPGGFGGYSGFSGFNGGVR